MDAIDRYLLHQVGFTKVKPPSSLSPKQWKQIPESAYVDRLLPYIWSKADPHTPDHVKAHLQDLMTSQTATAMMLRFHFTQAINALEEAGIDYSPVKGISLAQRLYGDPLARQSNDIDLLVHPRDRDKALDLFTTKLGCRIDKNIDDTEHHHDSLFRPAGQTEVHIELHSGFNLGARRGLPEEWWEGRVALQLGNRTVRIFRDDHLLVFLSIHAAVHGFQSWGWLLDIANLLRQMTCTTADIIAAARAVQRSKTVYHTLALLDYLGAPVDPALLQALKPKRDNSHLIRLLLFRGPRESLQFCKVIAILAMAETDEDGWFFPTFKQFRLAYPALSRAAATLLYVPWLFRGMARAGTGLARAALGLKR